MVDRNIAGCGNKPSGETLSAINVNKIFDSAKDKDCLEDLRVYLCPSAQDIVDHSSNIRVKDVEVITTNISMEEVPFNRGYYQVLIRFFFCITCEACVANANIKVIQGLCVYDKKVLLFGSEKNVSIFTSNPNEDNFCPNHLDLGCNSQSTLPTVVVEVAEPIALDIKLVERCRPFGNCCCNADAIPDGIRDRFGDTNFVDGAGINQLYVTIGMFTVIRMERPVSLLVPSCLLTLPDRDCTPAISPSDPCKIFSKMCFPVGEFFPFSEEPQPPAPSGGCKDRT
ncbi:MAG: hypothetical protein A2Y17_10725 [Clostridiales bacterium GWF2_38_85]|nr:MAG: hypothetical protein A2Y17_10725 [Clostridiales bacterium GWF2_38_85]HBL83503.1 hypothetical protein [Clostridiales bacterium]